MTITSVSSTPRSLKSRHDLPSKPKLRVLDIATVRQSDQRLLLLSDPLNLCGKQLLVSLETAPILGWMDGEHDLEQLTNLAASTLEQPPTQDQIVKLIDQLDQLALLEGEIYDAALQAALREYRQAEYRPLLLAELDYPADPDECRREFDQYLEGVELSSLGFEPRGLISPHIDYQRGWQVYAKVWASAVQVVEKAELAILLGTDHFSGDEPITLTRQSYATPYGVLPTDLEWVERAAVSLKGHSPFKGELRHRSEHSIELASVWLHHMRNGRPLDVLPILCGDLRLSLSEGDPDPDQGSIEAFINVLREAAGGRRTLVIAAADLSHAGPAFGDPTLGRPGSESLTLYDMKLMSHLERGDSAAFHNMIEREGNKTHVCGASPIYLALETLSPTKAVRIAYQHCPADDNGTSVVTICGHLLK